MMMLRRNNAPWLLRFILVITPLALVCIAVVAAMQSIHLAPAAPTFRQDQAELARLDAHSSDSHIADLRTTEARTDLGRPMTPSPASEEPATTVNVPPKEDSSLKAAQSKAVANRSHTSRSRSKRYQAELALQRQRAIAASQYRYAQQESGSFLSSIAHALGFSGR